MKESHQMKSIFEFFDAPVETDELLASNNSVDELYALCDDPMREPVKLVDDQLHFTDLAGIQDLFVDNTGFLVVGAVGLQGSGKSSLLNVMANYLPDETSGFDKPFAVQTVQNFLTNSPRTGGIDLYITQDRVILLDTQPLLSFSMTNYHAQSNCSAPSGMDVTQLTTDDHSSGYSSVGPGNWSLDVWAEISSLQLVSFLLNVCHVVLVVTDSLSTASIRLLRLIDRAASLKPTVYLPSVLTEPMKGVNAFSGRQFESVPPIGTQRFKSKNAPMSKTAAVYVNEVEERSRQDECTDDSRGSHDKGYANCPREPKTDVELDSTGARDLLEQDGLLSNGNPVQNRVSEIESSEIVDAVNRLKSMSDYSAALLHVYNQAPAAAFLDPVVCRQVNLYRNRILSSMFPGYRRLAALVTVGPRILTAHNASRSDEQVPIKAVAEPGKAVEPSTRLGLLTSESVAEQRNPSTCPYVCVRLADENIHDGSEVLSADPKMLRSSEDRYQQDKGVFTPEAPSTQKTVPPETHSTDCASVLRESTLPSEKAAPAAHSESAFRTQIQNLQPVFPCQTAPSEAEIDAECCMALQAVQSDLDRLLTSSTELDSAPDFNGASVHDSSSQEDLLDLTDYSSWSGDTLNTNISNIMNHVHSARKNFFDIQRRLNNPRFFLVPELDDEGNAPLGCPTYGSSVRFLQEAVFSTPRQHMVPYMTEKKWLSYAHNMWEAVCTSQILLDYYTVLKN